MIDTLLNKNLYPFYHTRLKHIIYSMAFLYTSAELMLIHVLTSSMREKYIAINKHLYPKSVQAAFNKTRPMDNTIILKEIVIDQKQEAIVINELMEEHFQLSVLAKRANKLFGLPMLITLCAFFQTLTTCIYYILHMITLNKNYQTIDILRSIWWSVPLIVHTWLLVHMWDSLANEVNILHFIENNLKSLIINLISKSNGLTACGYS